LIRRDHRAPGPGGDVNPARHDRARRRVRAVPVRSTALNAPGLRVTVGIWFWCHAQEGPNEESMMTETKIEKPVTMRRHIGEAISVRGLREEVKRADGVNAKIAVFLTNIVGSMWCAYVFAGIALIGLPPALRPGGEGIIAWIAQTFLQLVLLSVIMVGQNVQSVASDVRSQHTYDDTLLILDRLDVHTDGGLKDLADRLDGLEAAISGR
jgi:hypothetical protein